MDEEKYLEEELDIQEIDDEQINEEILKISNDSYVDDSTKAYLKEIGRYPLLSYEEQNELLRRYKEENDMDAFNKLLVSNLRLSVYVAKKFIHNYKSLTLLDLIQENNLTLMKALEKFDLSHGVKLSTYVVTAMERKALRVKVDLDTNIKNKYSRNPIYIKFKKFSAQYYHKHGKYPSKDEVIKSLGITNDQYESIQLAKNISEESLNQTIKDKKDSSSKELLDFIADEKNPYVSNEKFIDEQILKKALYDRLSKLEYYIIYNRILSEKEKTLEELGKELFVSRERIRQREAEILERIKPVLDKMQKETVRKYSIKELSNMNLTPISPMLLVTFDYLKKKIPDFSYCILYNKFFNKQNHNLEYYCRRYPYFSEEEIIEEIKNIQKLEKDFFNDEIMHKIIEQYKSKYKISEIFELDIRPSISKKYDELMEYINNLDYDDIKDDEYINNLDQKSKNLLIKYFSNNDNWIKTPDLFNKIERDINLYMLGYYNDNNNILTADEVRKILDKNSERLSDNQIELINEIYFKQSKDRRIRSRKSYVDMILLNLKFNFYGYHENELLIEQIKQVEENEKTLLTQEEKKLINEYYGIDTPIKTIKELALENGLTYVNMHDKLVNLKIRILKNYYGLDLEKKDISKDEFLEYINDPRYEFSDDTRKILIGYLQENKDYKQLASETGYSQYQISNFVTDGIRKANMYRYGVIKVFKLSDSELTQFFQKHQYDDKKIYIIKKYYLENVMYKNIAMDVGVSVGIIQYIILNFYSEYLADKLKEIPQEEYVKEVNSSKHFSMLNDLEKSIVSFKYGIKNSFNAEGKKYNVSKICDLLSISHQSYERNIKMIDVKIRERLLNLNTPEYGVIPRDELIELLKDKNLPIGDKEREMLSHIAEVDGYEYLDIDELAKKCNVVKKSFKRKYQRAVLSILQYKSNNKASQISYEKDILPIQKYFSNYDRRLLRMYYQDKLTAEQISKELNLSLNQAIRTVNRLRINVTEILNNSKTAKKFDFDEARKIINKDDFNLGDDKELLIEIYKMILGEDNYYKHTAKEVKDKLNLPIESSSISIMVYKVMIEIEKYKMGIRNIEIVTKNEVKDYYLENHNSFLPYKNKLFTRYLSKDRRFGEINTKVSPDIAYEVLKNNNRLVFDLGTMSKESMKKFIINHKGTLPKNIIKNIKLYYSISEREIMNGKDKLKILKMLNPLYQITLNKKLRQKRI